MNKKIKLLSTLALAGILTSSSFSGIVSATTTSNTTKTPDMGVYKKLVEGKNVVPFELKSTTDRVTISDLKEKFSNIKSVNGSSVGSENTVLGTGDYFQVGNETYYVVVYGDIDGDGVINSNDALLAEQYNVKAVSLSDVQVEAADVINDARVNSSDARHIREWNVKLTTDPVTPDPTPEQEEQEPQVQSAMTVNDKNIINNVNEKTTKIELDKRVELGEDETLRLDVYYEKDASMLKEARAASSAVTLSTVSGKVTVTGISDFSTLNDGKLYFRLYKVTGVGEDAVDTLLSETVVEKTTDVVPQIAKVTARRNGTNNVVYEGTRYGESDIQTIYYCAVPIDAEEAPVWNGTTKKFTYSKENYTAETFEIDVNGADTVNKELPGLTRGNAYKLYYVLENKKGTQSVAEFVEVAEDKSIKAESVATELKYDKTEKKFTWKAPTKGQQKGAKGYALTVYDAQGNVVAVDEVGSSEEEYILDLAKAKELGLGAGEYTIALVTKGEITGDETTDTVDSEEVKSENTIKIGQIAPITNVKYVMDEATGKPKLTWTERDPNCGGEKLTFTKDENNDDGMATNTSVAVQTKSDAGVPTSFLLGYAISLNSGKWEYQSGRGNAYANDYNALNRANSVELVATAKSSVDADDETAFYLDSEPTTFNFYIPYREFDSTATKISSTDKTVTLNLKIDGNNNYYSDTKSLVYGAELEDYTYQVRVYTSDGTYIKTVTPEPHLSDKNDANENGKYDDGEQLDFTVDGLASNTAYQFRLVTKCGKFEAWSPLTTSIRTMPKIQELEKADKADCEDNSKTFYTNGTDELRVEENDYNNGTEYPDGQYDALVEFLGALQNGDVITIDGDNIELVLNSENSAENVLMADYVEDKYITITGSDNEYELKTNAGKLPKEVHIKSGQFDITGLSVDEKEGVITLGNGSEVTATAGQKLTIEAGATVTVNGLKITSAKENVVRVGEDSSVKNTIIEVVANNNTLTFENVSAKVNEDETPDTITIKFVSSDGNDAVQQGSITILNKDESEAKIVVTQENVTVEGGLTVNVEKGEVDVSDVNITASKSVTLSKDAAITAVSEADAPEQLIGTTVTIKNYATVEELVAEFKDDASKGYAITSEVLARINTWLATFGINGKGAKVTVGSENKVTIAYEGTETLTVQGLK